MWCLFMATIRDHRLKHFVLDILNLCGSVAFIGVMVRKKKQQLLEDLLKYVLKI